MKSAKDGALNSSYYCGVTSKGLVRLQPGRRGGYLLARAPERINLREVLEAVEGPLFETRCLLHAAPGPAEREHRCPLHDVWSAATRAFLERLEGHTLAEISRRLGHWRLAELELAAALRRAPTPSQPRTTF